MRPNKSEIAVVSQQYTKRQTPLISRETFEALSPTHTDKQIAEALGLDIRRVNYWRNKWGIPSYTLPKGNRLYTIDDGFFRSIDSEEKAYILGLISADGSIHRNGRSIDIAFHPRDKPMLERMRTAMNSTAPIYSKTRSGGSPLVGLYLCSKSLIKDLMALGVTPKKSLTLAYPVLTSEYERHYIRGLWDGDGYIGPRQFVLVGTYMCLHGVQTTIANATGCLLSLAPIRNVFRLTGSRRDKLALHWIYAHSTIVFARKQERFLTYWQ